MTGAAELGRVQQVLVSGRIAERVTDRPLSARAARVAVVQGASVRPLAARFAQGQGGWYSVSTLGLPDLPDQGPLDLRLTVTLASGRDLQASLVLQTADLARTDRLIRVGGTDFSARVLAGTPFRLDLRADPAPVMLDGIVLANHDPQHPVADVLVSVGALTARTRQDGRFRLGPLPLAAQVRVDLTLGALQRSIDLRPDFTTPLNHAELSLPI